MIGLGTALLGGLAACGRKSALRPPPGATYPRDYPTQKAIGQPGEPEPNEDLGTGREDREPLVPPVVPGQFR